MKKFLLLVLVLGCAYAALLSKPELYFNKSVNYRGFTLRMRGAQPEGFEASLDAAYEKIAASELFNEADAFELIAPSSRGEFLFFTPLMGGDYYRVNPFSGAIYLASADFGKGEARTEPGARDFRKLSSVIAAAAAHDQARRRFQTLSYIFRTDWEIRGYAARVGGVSEDLSPSDACGKSDNPEAEDYKYALMLDTVMKEDNISFADLLGRKMSFETAEERMRRTHCGG